VRITTVAVTVAVLTLAPCDTNKISPIGCYAAPIRQG
jgi:hypothetical protein